MNAAVSKTVGPARGSGVRIPPPPPDFLKGSGMANPEREFIPGAHSKKAPRTEVWLTRAAKIWAAVGAIVLFLCALKVAGIVSEALSVAALAAFIVFILHGLVNGLEARGVPRAGGTLLALLLFLLVLAACLFAFVPAVVEQLTLLVNNLPEYAAQAAAGLEWCEQMFATGAEDGGMLDELLASGTSWITENATSVVSGLATGALKGAIGLGSGLVAFIIALIVAFWVLVDLPVICREFRLLFSDEWQDDLNIISSAMNEAFYGWFKTTLICALANGVLCGIVYAAMGLPYAVLLGFVCGVLYVIPYIGPAVACVVVGVVALFVSPLVFVAAVVVNVVAHNVVASGLSPALMKDSVNVHPSIILVMILAGGAVGGMLGMLLAIPLVAAVQGIFVAYFEARTGKQLSTVDGALFQKKHERDREALAAKTARFRKVK